MSMMVFADTTARDAWTSTGPIPNGWVCMTGDTGTRWQRQSGAWVPITAWAVVGFLTTTFVQAGTTVLIVGTPVTSSTAGVTKNGNRLQFASPGTFLVTADYQLNASAGAGLVYAQLALFRGGNEIQKWENVNHWPSGTQWRSHSITQVTGVQANDQLEFRVQTDQNGGFGFDAARSRISLHLV